MAVEIKNLQDILQEYVGSHKKLISSEISPLTAPGENYLSVMLKVDAVLKDEETGKEEVVHAVGKCIHSSGVHQFLLDIEKVNYKNEMAFYTEIIPTLQNFAKEKGLKKDFDIFPTLFAYRANLLGNSDEVDENSILLMENMKVNGYVNIDRHVGFDYEGAKIILSDLATFHAVPLALKLKNRQVFASRIKKHLGKLPFAPPKTEDGAEPPPPNTIVQDMWLELLENNDICKLYIPRLKKLVEDFKEKMDFAMEKSKSEPFATLSHNDMWVNNTMQVFQGKKVVKNKFVDFQMYTYDSPAKDLLFFIWSSIQLPVVTAHFNDLLKHYYSNFLQVLQELGCDGNTFSFDKFEMELKMSGQYVLFQCFMMFVIIFAEKGAFALDRSAGPDKAPFKKESITPSIQARVAQMIQCFGRKGWI